MSKKTFVKRTLIPAPPEDVFAWHKRPDAFTILSPPWRNVQVLEHTDGISDGARVKLKIHAGGMNIYWTLEHTGYIENKQFCDYQVQGPLRSWFHKHSFEPAPDGGTYYEDRIEYEPPFGFLGAIAGPVIERELQRLLDYRHKVVLHAFGSGSH